MNSEITDVQNSAENITPSSFKLIDRDRPETCWILKASPQSKERFYFEYNVDT